MSLIREELEKNPGETKTIFSEPVAERKIGDNNQVFDALVF